MNDGNFYRLFSRHDVDYFIELCEKDLALQKDLDLMKFVQNKLHRLYTFREKVWGECKR